MINIAVLNLSLMKRIVLLSFFLLTSLFTNAQKFHFGLMAAPGIAWMKVTTSGVSSDASKIGFSYGIVTEFAFNKAENYAFATGVQASYRGGSILYHDTTTIKLGLQYLEIPITLKMKTNEIGAIKYFGQFGVVPGINIKAAANSSTKIAGGNNLSIDYKNYQSHINPITLSLLIALGFEYNLTGTTSGFVSIDFNNGLIDIIRDRSDLNADAISNLLELKVGILF